MDVLSITESRQKLGELVKMVKYQKCVIPIGQHGKPEALLIAYPEAGHESLAAINAASGSFKFLEEEPDLYTVHDLRQRYA